MDQLRRIMATIQEYLGKLTITHRLLIGSIAIILLMTLFLVSQYAGSRQMEELWPGAEQASLDRAVAFLSERGIEHETSGGKVLVPVAQASYVRAQLAQHGQLPDDTTLLFGNLIDKQKWTMSRDQLGQLSKVALQNELAKVIANFDGIAKASVFLDVPERSGLGRGVRTPTASVNVTTSGGGALGQAMVDAIAATVAGANAGLTVDRIRVINGSTGRQRKATTQDDMVSATWLEHATKVEQQTRTKITDLLSYIPGVVVAVTAQVDIKQHVSEIHSKLKENDGSWNPVISETTNSRNQSQAKRSAEPGPRSNQPADINWSSSGNGTSMTETEEETTFQPFPGTKDERIIDPRGMPTRLAVSVNVPMAYVASLLATGESGGGSGEGKGGPDEQAVKAKFAEIQADITASIKPHVKTSAEGVVDEGEVVVSMIPGDAFMPGGTGGGGSAMAGGGLLALGGGGGLIEKALLGLLSVVALGMMVLMVRKSSRKVELPSAEEIVGIPPPLDTMSEVVGEADVSEAAMAGIEVGEDEIRAGKIFEQVSDLVKQNPEAGARLLSRWITSEN